MSRYYDWPEYVPVAERRRRAAREVAKMNKSGRKVSPVEIEGKKIVTTFWGDAWCKNLEAYSDFANRLPRGRTYVRNGSVLDLQIEAGRVKALVSGSSLYTVDIEISSLPKRKWTGIKARCAGQIGSLVELLQGSISQSVMEIVTCKGQGLFPAPAEITLECSCPDWATMCKHVAATLYGVGARLDREPELLFTLRKVDATEMVEAAIDQPVKAGKARKGRVLRTDELSSVFGVDIEMDDAPAAGEPSAPARRTQRTRSAAKTAKPAAAKVGTKKRASKKAAAKPAAAKAGSKKRAVKKAAAKPAAAKVGTKKRAVKKAAAKPAAAKAGSKKRAVKKTAAKPAAAKVGTKKSAARPTAAKVATKKKA